MTLKGGVRYDLQFLKTIDTDSNNVVPRFAWSAGKSRDTVVRGRFGLFYDRIPLRALPNGSARKRVALFRELVDTMCRAAQSRSDDVVDRTVDETLLESVETSGPTTGTRPIQPAPGLAPILPLHVAASLPAGAQPNSATPQPPTGAARSNAPAAARAAPAPGGVSTVPEGTVMTVITLDAVSAANHAGETFRAITVQPVIVNGVQLIPAQTPVTMGIVQASDGLSLRLTAVILAGRTVAASSLPAEPAAITERNNATLQRRADAPRANAQAQDRATELMVVLSGPQLNIRARTRLTFKLSAPLAGGR